MSFVAKADDLLRMIDPIIGVAGKGAAVTFTVASTGIFRVGLTNQSESALCLMYANVSGSKLITEWEAGISADLTLDIDQLVAALKTFGTDKAKFSYSPATRRVTIENDMIRRTIRTLDIINTARAIMNSLRIEIEADPSHLKKAIAFESISEYMECVLEGGRLSLGCKSEMETAEIHIDAGVHITHRSDYSSSILADIFRRIHSDVVVIGVADDAPLELSFEHDCAEFRIFVAPLICTV